MTKYDYDSNEVARVYDDGKWYLVNRADERISDGYTYIEEWGDGYYKAEQGARKNILRPDGSVVLKVWHNDVYRVRQGFFVFSNTIRKSKTNPKTRNKQCCEPQPFPFMQKMECACDNTPVQHKHGYDT